VHVVPNDNVTAVRPFIQQVKRCEESLLKIKSIEKAIEEKNIGNHREFISDKEYTKLQDLWEVHEKTGGNDESRLEEIEEEVNKMARYQQELITRKNDIKEKLLFLRENIAKVKAGEQEYGQAFFEIKNKASENPDQVSVLGLNELEVKSFVAEGPAVNSVKRTLNRITRGNSFINEVPYSEIFQSLYPGE
jgi:hypothetical protein